MGKHKQDVCPGCSRHCPLSHVRCKYGQKYIDKQRRAQETAPSDCKKDKEKAKLRKWEKLVTQGSTVWKLLFTGSQLKRALRKGQITERQIHLALSDEEQERLHTLLEKITRILA